MSETRELVAILVADIVGYSRLAGADEDRILTLPGHLPSLVAALAPAVDAAATEPGDAVVNVTFTATSRP